ncbi:MAG TPA: hypothetical protein VGA06_00470 [Candidatus Paceibacterota bacterium]|jgi:hypothetical protein
MFGSLMFRQLLHSKLGDMPEAEQEKLMELIEKNPDVFEKIATEAQGHMQAGKDQMSAIALAIRTNEMELRNIAS